MNSCIRVFADINQIKACKENISFVDESAEYLANSLNLAGFAILIVLMLIVTYNDIARIL